MPRTDDASLITDRASLTEPSLPPPSMSRRTVVALVDVGSADVELVGGKGANLGELLRAGLPVPAGFVVTSTAYLDAMATAGIRDRLAEFTRDAAGSTPSELEGIAAAARRLVADCTLPDELVEAVNRAFAGLGDGTRVAVRSSATAEDTADTSFAGMNESFTNVTKQEVVDRILDCWTSLFGARVVAYRAERGLLGEPAIAVIVQTMVESDRSGVMFTANPARMTTPASRSAGWLPPGAGASRFRWSPSPAATARPR